MPILFRPVVACVEVKLLAHWQSAPDTAVMTLHAKTPASAPDAAACEEIVGVVQTWAETDLAPLISNDWLIYTIVGESMAVDPPPFFAVSTSIDGTAGGSTGAIYAPLILLHGSKAARTQLGRSYVFAPADADTTAGGYSTTLLDGLVSAFETLNTNLSAGGYSLAVPSKKVGQCVFVNSYTHSNRLTVQKRRRVGFGG